MRTFSSNLFVAATLAVVAVTAFQVAGATAQKLIGHQVKFPEGVIGLQPGEETKLEGWSQKAEPYLAGRTSQPTLSELGLMVNGARIGGFLLDESVTESGDKSVDYYFALSSMITNPKASTLTVELDGYKGLQVEVGYRTDLGGTVAPIKASRTKSGDGICFTYDASKLPVSTPTQNDP